MAKIIALFINELIKISKKTSVYVILILMLVAMFLTGGILKFVEDKASNQATNPNIKQFLTDDMQTRLSNLQSQQTQDNDKIASATLLQKKQLEIDSTNLGYQIDALNTAISKNVFISSESKYYVALAIQDVANYKTEVNILQASPANVLTQTQKDTQALLATLIPRMEKVVANKDFKDYTAIINDRVNANADMTQSEKDIQLEQNNLRLKYNVTNEDKNTVSMRSELSVTSDDVISNIALARRSLADNLDFSANSNAPVPLTNERRNQITDNMNVYLKQLEAGAVDTNKFPLLNYILGIGIFMIEILLLILGGGAISQELATGSIKSLIISPTKRWKIYVAKLLSLIVVGVISAVICYFIGVLVLGVFFGLGSASPYIFTSAGKAMQINFYLFSFAKLFVGLIVVGFYMVLSLMLSTITRNTAASVGISIGVLFGGSIAYSVLTRLLTGEWLKFLPFANFDFSSKIFPFDPSNAASTGATTSLTFSTIYILVAIGLMFYIGLDSFNRRDIK